MNYLNSKSLRTSVQEFFSRIKIAVFIVIFSSLYGVKLYADNLPDEGMWLPILLERLNYVDMQKMGLHLTAEELYSINHSSLKDAIVGLSRGGAGGFFCTAEVVSPEGLIFTNHHCGYGSVQALSTTEHDYLTNGFWALSKAEELKNENLSASFLVRMENVTDSIIPFLPENLKESERSAKVKEISERIRKRAGEKGKYEASVRAFYGGNEYYLFVYEIYKDVRLAGAPPSSIGKFGGDTDNWMWPRHTGDFTVFRIYAGPENKPADYSESNVPYKPKYYLPISLKGIRENDFAMTWGYPAGTTRYLASYGLEYNLNTNYPALIKLYGKRLEIMKERMDADAKVRIDYAATYQGIANTWKNYIGQSKMLVKNKVEDKKKEIETGFTNWVNQDPARKKKYGNVLPEIKSGYEQMSKITVPYYYANSAGMRLDIIGFANRFAGMKTALENRNKTAIRETADGMKPAVEQYFRKLDPAISKKTFTEMLKLYSVNVPQDQLPSIFLTIKKDYDDDITAFADAVYNTSVFATQEKINKFLADPKLKVLQKDLAWIAAQSFTETSGKYSSAFSESGTLVSAGNRHFIAGLQEMNPELVPYPDANSTMRMSYGQVLDYFPADAVHYEYFTTLKGVMEKEDPSNDEFIVDQKLKDLYAAKDYGQYGQNGEMITCFLTTNDITGGNSGSPVINGDGQLIGLAFDGNWEAMSSDILFEPDLQRTISVDIRYVLFIIDKFAGATNLIKELTLVK
jgi:hypothetical protein